MRSIFTTWTFSLVISVPEDGTSRTLGYDQVVCSRLIQGTCFFFWLVSSCDTPGLWASNVPNFSGRSFSICGAPCLDSRLSFFLIPFVLLLFLLRTLVSLSFPMMSVFFPRLFPSPFHFSAFW